jgi:hypothetical protein
MARRRHVVAFIADFLPGSIFAKPQLIVAAVKRPKGCESGFDGDRAVEFRRVRLFLRVLQKPSACTGNAKN